MTQVVPLNEYCVTCPAGGVPAESVTTGATVYQPSSPLGEAGLTDAVVTAPIARGTLAETLPATSVARKSSDSEAAPITVGLV